MKANKKEKQQTQISAHSIAQKQVLDFGSNQERIKQMQMLNSKEAGYDPVIGRALAKASLAEAGGRTVAGGQCYHYVANAIDNAVEKFLTGMHAYMAADQLAARKDLFVEVAASNLSSLPPGAIVVWGKGTSKSGHISISQGDGKETSDFIGNQMTSHYGGASARVFLPKEPNNESR